MFGTVLAGTIITGYGILTATAGIIANTQGADMDRLSAGDGTDIADAD